MCCHEMNHLHAIIRYHFFDFDVCVVIFNVSYIESFYEKYSMFGKSKLLCMSFSVIETYDHIFLHHLFVALGNFHKHSGLGRDSCQQLINIHFTLCEVYPIREMWCIFTHQVPSISHQNWYS